MARRARRDQFVPELNPTLHCTSQCVRQAFLLGRDPVTGVDHSHRRAWAVRRLRELAAVFAIDVDTYAFLENHMHLLLTLRWDLASEWAAEDVVDRWLRITGARADPIEREMKRERLLHDDAAVDRLRRRLCHPADFHKLLKQPLAVMANREDGVRGPFWAGRYGCFKVEDEGHRLAVMRYIDLNQVRAGVVDAPEASVHCGIRERVLVMQQVEANREERERRRHEKKKARAKKAATTTAPSRRATARENTAKARRDEVAEMVHKRPERLRHAEDAIWLTPIEPRNGRRGVFSSMRLRDYLKFVDATGRRAVPGKRGRIPAELAPILDRLNIDPDRLERLQPPSATERAASPDRPLKDLHGSIHGGPAACRAEARRLGVRSIRSAFDVERRPKAGAPTTGRKRSRTPGYGSDDPFE